MPKSNLGTSDPKLLDIDPAFVELGQTRWTPLQIKLNPTHLGRSRPALGRTRLHFGRNRPNSGRNHPELVREPIRTSPKFGPPRTTLVRPHPKLDRHSPKLVGIDPNLFESNPGLPKAAPHTVEPNTMWPSPLQIVEARPDSVKAAPLWDEPAPACAEPREPAQNVAETAPKGVDLTARSAEPAQEGPKQPHPLCKYGRANITRRRTRRKSGRTCDTARRLSKLCRRKGQAGQRRCLVKPASA